MNINRNNYEKYFIDYLEGTLSKDDIHDLRVFLLFNQDLAELLDDIAKIKLTAPSVRYTRKENLKKDELHAVLTHGLGEHKRLVVLESLMVTNGFPGLMR